MNELQQLAAFASGLAWEDIPAPVKSAAKASILDTLSVALGGVSYPMFQHIKEVYLKTEEGCHSACLFGDSRKTSLPHCRLPECHVRPHSGTR